MGITVSSSKFTDQDYADDAVLFSDCPSEWPYILSSFDEAAHTMGLTGEEGLAIRICRRRLSIFGHVRRLPEATPAHSALRLAVDARTGGKPDIRPEWKRQRG